MKAECMSLVCRMVKVFFPSRAADSAPGRRIVAPAAAETAMNSRRVSVFMDLVFIVVSYLWLIGPHPDGMGAARWVDSTFHWTRCYLPPAPASICFWIFSRLKEPAVWLGGYSFMLMRNFAAIP